MRFYTQKVTWRRCGSKSQPRDQCGTALVPLDHLNPAGATITIAMRKVPATDPKARIGSLFVNPGGPGGSGIEMAQYATTYFGADVRRVYDIVGFDPRGIGESSQGFQCFTDADLDAMNAADRTPETDAERSQLVAAARKRLAGCLERGGALVKVMGSNSVAADLDILRAVVGDSRLNYYGVSYGTLIGAVYADNFTDRVGRMVLDSTVPTRGLTQTETDQFAVDGEFEHVYMQLDSQFEDFVEACQDFDPCPFPKDVKAAKKKLGAWFDGLEKAPVRTREVRVPRMTQGWAGTLIRETLQTPESWKYVAEALNNVFTRKDYRYAAYLAGLMVDKNDDGTYREAIFQRQHLPIHCIDWAKETGDAVWPSKGTVASAGVWADVIDMPLADCRQWTGPTRQFPVVSAYLDHPVMVIGNTGDNITPVSTTEEMAESLQGSVLVEVEAKGHGAYSAGNSCADRFVDSYLARGVAPTSFQVCRAD